MPGSELWKGSVELWAAADQNKVGTGEAHPVSVGPGSALSGSCLTWKELFVCLPCAMGTRLDQGRSTGSCGSRWVAQVWEPVTGRELCPACAVDPRGGRIHAVDAEVHFLLPRQEQSEELK